MPFDFSPTETNTVADTLRRARALIENECDWRPKAAMNGPFCTLGAIWFVAEGRPNGLAGHIQALFRKAIGINEWASIGAWNDKRTHVEVLAAFDKAIALAESGQ